MSDVTDVISQVHNFPSEELKNTSYHKLGVPKSRVTHLRKQPQADKDQLPVAHTDSHTQGII